MDGGRSRALDQDEPAPGGARPDSGETGTGSVAVRTEKRPAEDTGGALNGRTEVDNSACGIVHRPRIARQAAPQFCGRPGEVRPVG